MNKDCFIRVRPETHAAIKRLAIYEERPMSTIVDRAVREYARRHYRHAYRVKGGNR